MVIPSNCDKCDPIIIDFDKCNEKADAKEMLYMRGYHEALEGCNQLKGAEKMDCIATVKERHEELLANLRKDWENCILNIDTDQKSPIEIILHENGRL